MLPTIATGNVASAISGGYEVANSCRFNDGDSPYLSRTFGGAGDLDKWTFSCWYKRSAISSATQRLFGAGSNNTTIYFTSNDKLAFYDAALDTGWDVQDTTWTLFRDPSAWFSIVWTLDSAQAVAANRVKCYINGTQQTLTKSGSGGDQDFTTAINTAAAHYIGKRPTHSTGYLDGYLAEVCFCDGQAYAASDFGEFDEDSPTIWKPIDVSGLTFGTNGFYLDFEDSANLGNDANGGTDWTESNLAATDQATDTPTNNFATLNPLYKLDNITFSEGNLQHSNAASWQAGLSTIGVSSGKWYWEVKFTAVTGGSNNAFIGICKTDSGEDNTIILTGNSVNSWGYQNTSGWKNDSTVYETGDYDSWTVDDIVGGYLDLDNLKLYFTKNGTLQNSGTGISVTAGTYVLGCSNYYGTSQVNYGNPPFTISSGNTDGTYGNFEYSTTITGDSVSKTFKALCTKNLAEYG